MIHHVFACKSNIGDWLSARAIQSLIGDVPVVEHFCDEPFVAETLDELAQLGPDDLVVIGGGGLFMDYFTSFWEGFRPLASQVPFCVWGVGYCDIKDRPSRADQALLREVLGFSRLTVVRDELTRELLRGCDLPAPILCPSVTALPPRASLTRGLLHSMDYAVVGEAGYAAVREVASAYAAQTGRSYAETNNQIENVDEAQLAAVVHSYAAADLIVSSRLHGCIIGLSLGRKVLAISGDRKVESFMSAVGLADWIFPLDDLSSLGGSLARLSDQPDVQDVIERARMQNRRIGARVRALVPTTAPVA
jgi:polysaccharide pyruvyl transferase WcaK-like protein